MHYKHFFLLEKDVIEDSTSTDVSDYLPGTSSMVQVEVYKRL